MHCNRKRILWLLFAALITAVLCSLQYRLDNKYNASGPRAKNGVLDLLSADSKMPLSILTYGWEVYPQELLAPGEFDGHAPVYRYLGQFGGFEGENGSGSPHGSATYRLEILLPPQPMEYALELPEIYSSSCVWVNGRLVQRLGDVTDSDSKPSVRTGMVTFEASGRTELVIQASNYSHYYSGLTYPPAFGTVQAVSDLISTRLLRTCIMVISSLTIGIMYLMVGLKIDDKRNRMILFSLTSIMFAVHVMYPLLHQFGAGAWSYRLEDASFYLLLLLVSALHCRLCGIGANPRRIVYGAGITVAVLSAVIPSILGDCGLSAMMAYSSFLDGYRLLLFGWLIITALFNREPGETMTGPLLAGLCVIAVSLLFQTTAPIFEPIRFGWPTENAGFVLILLLGGGLWLDTVSAYAERAVLAENTRLMKKQFAIQEENYRLVTENFEEVRRLRHDLRHHLNAVAEFARMRQYEELNHYIAGCADSVKQAARPTLCENHAVSAVLNYYVQLCGQKEIPLELKISLPPKLKLEDWDLGLLYGNLLENAVEASQKLPPGRREIQVFSKIANGNLLLTVKNTWNGLLLADGGQIASTKHSGPGIGLSSVQALVKRCGGQFFLKPEENEFSVSIVLWQQVDMPPGE